MEKFQGEMQNNMHRSECVLEEKKAVALFLHYKEEY